MNLKYQFKKMFGIKDKPTTKDISLSLQCSGDNAGEIHAIAKDSENYCELAISGYSIGEDEGALVGKSLAWDRVPLWRKEQMKRDRRLVTTWEAIRGYLK